MTKKGILISFAVLIIIIGGAVAISTSITKLPSPATSEKTSDVEERAVVYKTADCGCCRVYTKYLPNGGIETDSVDISKQELDQMRTKYAIPDKLASCHITKIGGYFVSGHIPVEAIKKLLTEKPDIAGIALAGMPTGTPGMPGSKNESWAIYGIGRDGSTSEFMSI